MNKDHIQESGQKFFAPFLKIIPLLFLLCVPVVSMIGQDTEEAVDKPVRATFNSALLIDNQSVMVPIKGTFEFDIFHRFGTLGNGYSDLYGLYASSNMKLGFTYAPINNLSVGLGLTKRKHILDFNAKYALLQQTRSGKMPLSLTYYGNMAIDTREEGAREIVYHTTDRFSYFHQLIVARKFSDWLSLQIAGSLSHYNMINENMKNDHFAISGGGRVKMTETMSCIFNIDQPITVHKAGNPNPNLSLGIEMATSAHAFQVFVGNYASIVPQENNFFNSNNYAGGENETVWDNFLIGFNITRLWNW